MRRESSLILWASFPVLAALRESGASRKRRPLFGVGFDTLIRLAVWAFLTWSAIRGDWWAVFGLAAVIAGLSLTALAFRWYADRRGWRQRWLQS